MFRFLYIGKETPIMSATTEYQLRPVKELYDQIHGLVKSRLWLQVIIGMLLGVILGGYLSTNPSWIAEESVETLTNWIALPGSLFIRIVQMIMIPLMFSSIIQGIAGGQNKEYLLTAGPRVIGYFLMTSVITLILAVSVAFLLKPGNYIEEGNSLASEMLNLGSMPEKPEFGLKQLPTILTNLLPENPLASMASGEMLSIVIFALIVGVALVNVSEQTATPVLQLMFSVQEITMTVTRWAMKLAPVAVFGLLCQVTSKVGLETIIGLSMFVITVLSGLLMVIIFYNILLVFVARVSLRKFYSASRDLLLLAFSMSSSAAVMPLTLKTAEEKLKISPTVSRFIIPVGTSLNMDGTAVFQAIATIFLAQVYGLNLDLMSIVLVIVTTIAASIGTPSAPGAGVIVLGSVLGSIGIPVTAIALIIGVDRLLGMFRTSVNVVGDLVACMIFDKYYRRESESVELKPQIAEKEVA